MSDSALLERPDVRPEAHAGIIDCDIHPAMKAPDEIHPFLPERWRKHLQTYGNFTRQAFSEALSHPRMTPEVSRMDAWPPGGGPPGSDVPFLAEHHLDANGIALGVLVPLRGTPGNQRNLDFGAAMATAVNDWQVEKYVRPEPRLRASINVVQDDPAAAIAEIERRAGDRRFVQVLLPPRSTEPLGRRRYWPIYEAAVHHGLPLSLHVGGVGGHPATGAGWPSYYLEEHHSQVQTMAAQLASFVLEGVFEHLPDLKLSMVEGGFSWVPALCWRLDKHWRTMRDEVPHLTRPPSEYVKRNVWFTTQPIEEPHPPSHLRDVFSWLGTDRLMFSTDYPHWDFDDPRYAFKVPLDEAEKAAIFRGNAAGFYGLA